MKKEFNFQKALRELLKEKAPDGPDQLLVEAVAVGDVAKVLFHYSKKVLKSKNISGYYEKNYVGNFLALKAPLDFGTSEMSGTDKVPGGFTAVKKVYYDALKHLCSMYSAEDASDMAPFEQRKLVAACKKSRFPTKKETETRAKAKKTKAKKTKAGADLQAWYHGEITFQKIAQLEAASGIEEENRWTEKEFNDLKAAAAKGWKSSAAAIKDRFNELGNLHIKKTGEVFNPATAAKVAASGQWDPVVQQAFGKAIFFKNQIEKEVAANGGIAKVHFKSLRGGDAYITADLIKKAKLQQQTLQKQDTGAPKGGASDLVLRESTLQQKRLIKLNEFLTEQAPTYVADPTKKAGGVQSQFSMRPMQGQKEGTVVIIYKSGKTREIEWPEPLTQEDAKNIIKTFPGGEVALGLKKPPTAAAAGVSSQGDVEKWKHHGVTQAEMAADAAKTGPKFNKLLYVVQRLLNRWLGAKGAPLIATGGVMAKSTSDPTYQAVQAIKADPQVGPKFIKKDKVGQVVPMKAQEFLATLTDISEALPAAKGVAEGKQRMFKNIILEELVSLIKEKKKKKKKDPKAKVRNRGTVVFPAESSKVKDDKDHFPINSEAQARNALSRASQYSKVPKWYKGTLKSLVGAVQRKVKAKYKGIETTKASAKPGKG
jgi:hypothetical protein